jgi:hypothetical protein
VILLRKNDFLNYSYVVLKLIISAVAFYKDGQSVTKPHQGHGCKRSGRVRKAVISEHDGGGAAESELSSSFMVNSIGKYEQCGH